MWSGVWYVRGCVVFRRYIIVCNSEVVSIVNMYPANLKLCVLMVECRLQ